MDHQQMHFLNACRTPVRYAQMDVAGRKKFTDAAAASAGERNDMHRACMCCLHRSNHVGRVAGRGKREQHVTRKPQRLHLFCEYLLERVVVGDRGEQ